ncbi:MAG TPA: SWIM zinc finger family protein [Ktedonobacteraceae bacterium]|nr:SWIM zinc finger family protein [Ktedonobacteraceae bacterium]
MGRWRDNDYWDYYEPSRPIKVEGGIKAKSERGEIGSTWWSKRWIGVLESFSMGTRLTRGRSYARQGQVISIDIEPGVVKAKVQGSQPKPYNIKIQLRPLSDQDWEEITEAMASQAIFAAKLLAGEMPTNIEEAFHAVKLSLFPTAAKDLVTDCSCPDWANPCKHIAAVYYLLAERFDEDPFLIFKLRGRTKDEIIQALREKRTETLPVESAAPSTSDDSIQADDGFLLEDNLDTFWQEGEGLDGFTVNPTAPEVDKAILKRLGDAPFTIEGHTIAALLARAYDVVDAAISQEVTEEQV